MHVHPTRSNSAPRQRQPATAKTQALVSFFKFRKIGYFWIQTRRRIRLEKRTSGRPVDWFNHARTVFQFHQHAEAVLHWSATEDPTDTSHLHRRPRLKKLPVHGRRIGHKRFRG